jgi:hypothetical protein
LRLSLFRATLPSPVPGVPGWSLADGTATAAPVGAAGLPVAAPATAAPAAALLAPLGFIAPFLSLRVLASSTDGHRFGRAAAELSGKGVTAAEAERLRVISEEHSKMLVVNEDSIKSVLTSHRPTNEKRAQSLKDGGHSADGWRREQSTVSGAGLPSLPKRVLRKMRFEKVLSAGAPSFGLEARRMCR